MSTNFAYARFVDILRFTWIKYIRREKSSIIKTQMGIFQIFFIQRDIKRGTKDPGGFLAEQAMDFVKIYLIIGSLIGFGLVVLMGILGMTDWLGGPYGVARFFFWLFLIIFVPSELFFILLFIRVKRILRRNLDRTVLAVKAKIQK